MFLPLDNMKAMQAASVVALSEGRRIGKLRLLKLLYIADRRSLRETGRPLLGCKAVAMDHGPLHSDVLKALDNLHPKSHEWARHFEQQSKRDFVLKSPADNNALSRYEIELLQDVVAQHEQIDDWHLSELTHDFEEWKKHWQQGTSRTIPLEDIIDAVGRGDDKAAILSDLRDDLAFDQFFERCNTP
jgi:uncharacterized phage-associated protein